LDSILFKYEILRFSIFVVIRKLDIFNNVRTIYIFL
jgi:hypothetical protein